MKRLIFLLTVLCGLAISGQAQQTIFTPTCAGTDDTAAFQSLITGAASNPRTIQIPYKSDLTKRCRITTLTVPSNVVLDNTNGSGIHVVTSIGVAGPRVNPVGKTMFFGGGTVTLTGRAYDSLADTTNAGIVTTTTSSSQVVSTNDPRLAGVYAVSSYTPAIVTVLAPTVAPALTAPVTMYGSGAFVDTVTYLIAYTYTAWTGETQISPTASVTISNGQGVAALPRAPTATRSTGAKFYASNDGGVSWHAVRVPFIDTNTGTTVGFGDNATVWGGGVSIRFNASGAAAPGANTAADRDGTAVANPTLAPTLYDVAKMPPSTQFFGAYSYVAEDGTETALSPISSGVTTAAQGAVVAIRVTQEPPSGAVFVRLYLGTSASGGAMKFQRQVPLSFVTNDIHTYDAAGAANSPGAAQSTISTFQQAYDAAMSAGGGRVLVGPGPHDFKVPIILRQRNVAGSEVVGIRVMGTGSHEPNGTNSLTRLRYTGTTVGVEGVASFAKSLTWDGVDVADPNSRVKYGLAMGDISSGGSFTSYWRNAAFAATAPGGIGLRVGAESRSASSHTASEQDFDWVSFAGTAWGVDLHSGQTGDFRFKTVTLWNSGNSNSADSGDARIAHGGFNVHFVDYNSNGYGNYNFFLTQNRPHLTSGASSNITLKHPYSENQVANFYLYNSALDTNGATIYVAHGNFGNHTGHEVYALYTGGPSRVTFEANERGAGNVFLNHAGAVLLQTGGDQMLRVGIDFFKQTSPSYTANNAALSIYGSVQRFVNESNNASTLTTNSGGDLVLSPYLAVKVSGKAFKTANAVALATTTPVDIGTSLAAANIVTYTPTQDSTINLASVPTSQEFTLIVTTSGASSFTITFGTNFKTTGTLATGTVTAKVFVLTFVCNGTSCIEVSRTTAM